ncbi:MAG: Unknown protein [uncultured Thiotrichaceae bacterium]|uniref:Uncharacterized protein n=1 Tax=uncultured Thiotrichaceae bacterium TaxID=298394 RepID=A0A6S6TCH3_9GAMM|nr:MAG: Unknown protein [uncultured Thiotrichaceae bacterium]
MTSTLLQKHPIKGSREFNLVDDEVFYTIQSPHRTESLSVVLNVLDPEPVISGSVLSFVSQVNREPLLELFLDKPDKESFDQFVNIMRLRIAEEDFSLLRVRDKGVEVDVAQISESIDMLQKYVDPAEIELLLSSLLELKTKPDDVNCLSNVAKAFNDLGFVQGQVLTYAPYINFLLSGSGAESTVAI